MRDTGASRSLNWRYAALGGMVFVLAVLLLATVAAYRSGDGGEQTASSAQPEPSTAASPTPSVTRASAAQEIDRSAGFDRLGVHRGAIPEEVLKILADHRKTEWRVPLTEKEVATFLSSGPGAVVVAQAFDPGPYWRGTIGDIEVRPGAGEAQHLVRSVCFQSLVPLVEEVHTTLNGVVRPDAPLLSVPHVPDSKTLSSRESALLTCNDHLRYLEWSYELDYVVGMVSRDLATAYVSYPAAQDRWREVEVDGRKAALVEPYWVDGEMREGCFVAVYEESKHLLTSVYLLAEPEHCLRVMEAALLD